jgi:hypothetical protein
MASDMGSRSPVAKAGGALPAVVSPVDKDRLANSRPARRGKEHDFKAAGTRLIIDAEGRRIGGATMPGQREQAIRERAYAIWEEKGRPSGKDLDHWLQAQGEIIRCIFCLEERIGTDEHVFPFAIGGCLKTKRVCACCNAKLGSRIDAALIDHSLILLRRAELGIAGESGKVPDAFRHMFGDAVQVTGHGD